jgi:protein deglycase
VSSVLVPLAAGFEEIEAVTIIDLLRRADIEVITAGLLPGAVTGSHGITLTPDMTLDTAIERSFEMVVLPGGMPGAANLAADARILKLLRTMADRGGFVAAICAAPSVLAKAGLLAGRRATSYPGFLTSASAPGIVLAADPIVVDGTVITSRGPGTAMDFALALIEQLEGAAARHAVEDPLQRPGPDPVR